MKKRIALLTGLLVYWPFPALAIPLILKGLIVGAVATLGMSVFRTVAPTNLENNIEFFSSCWSCALTSGLIDNLSDFIPRIYDALASNILMIAVGLTFVFYAWRLLKTYFTDNSAAIEGWTLAEEMVRHLIKLLFVGILLFFPLPSFISHNFIAPIMNVGLSYNNVIRETLSHGDNTFGACLVATAITDTADPSGGFPPSLRHNIACQIAEFHQMTGLGMSIGWTFLNMAFSFRYGIFPNIFMIFAGAGIMAMFFWALVPIPIYFVKTFISIAFGFIMLPLALLGWLFKGLAPDGIFPSADMGIMKIIDDVVKGTVGVALVGLFTGFALLFLSAVIGEMNGVSALVYAIENDDSIFLMDSLVLNNNGLVDILLVGLFIGMFMNAIPALIHQLFETIDTGEYKKAVSIQNAITASITGLYKQISERLKKPAAGPTPPPAGGTP